MVAPDAPAALPSVGRLTATTVRRTVVIGRLYLGIGAGMALVLALILVLSAHPTTFQTVFPLELPLFSVLGSTGGLMTFTSDRTKGVFEYLISYGIRPRTLFLNGLASTAAMTSVILGLGLTVGLGAAVARGVPVTSGLEMSLALYTIPVSYGAALFTTMVGMAWAAISTPRAGMNSPVGLAPMVGVAPVLFVLLLAETAPPSQYYDFTGVGALVILAATVGLLAMSGRLMGRERFLSPL
jgi:hypothetical protein